jgi:hypothetical protein
MVQLRTSAATHVAKIKQAMVRRERMPIFALRNDAV